MYTFQGEELATICESISLLRRMVLLGHFFNTIATVIGLLINRVEFGLDMLCNGLDSPPTNEINSNQNQYTHSAARVNIY